MIFWSVVFIVISLLMLFGNFYNIPFEAYQIFPLTTLLGSLGLLYRTLTKIKTAEKEKYKNEINNLSNQLENYKTKITNSNSDSRMEK